MRILKVSGVVIAAIIGFAKIRNQHARSSAWPSNQRRLMPPTIRSLAGCGEHRLDDPASPSPLTRERLSISFTEPPSCVRPRSRRVQR
jgi:hypothetical protein